MGPTTQMGKALAALRIAALVCVAASAAACAPFGAHDPNSPGWFKSRLKDAEKKPFPKLAAVPALPQPPRPAGDWNVIESDVNQAGAALDASPRSLPSDQTPDQTAAFEAQARQDVNGKNADGKDAH